MKRTSLSAACVAVTLAVTSASFGQTDSNSAMNAPDEVAWRLFATVNASAGGTNVLFETWASDTDTFRPNPVFPGKVTPLSLHLPALQMAARENAQLEGRPLPAIPPNGSLEESRRNYAAFKFIVDNHLYSKSGLAAAFGKTLSFPVDSIEVKANWVAESDLSHDNTTYPGSKADIPKNFHVNLGAGGKPYVLVSMHIISKLVPNWTWATFESRYNPGRCDILGCSDKFGMNPNRMPPNGQSGQDYGDCTKTAAVSQMLSALEPAFKNYCLKGSQIDFTDAVGLATRLGNSVTENGFVDTSSCMTCHGRATWDANGAPRPGAGFMGRVGPLGPLMAPWYWSVPQPPPNGANYPFEGMSGLQQLQTSADFVWAIPFCAYDDTDPAHPKPSRCAGRS